MHSVTAVQHLIDFSLHMWCKIVSILIVELWLLSVIVN